jgi:hypothetical protein
MANSLLTIDMITREAIPLFVNSNAMLKGINRQYDSYFAKDGAKIGDTLRIRLPNDFTVRSGPAASVQSTNEQRVTLTLSNQVGVDTSFSSADLTLKLDDYIERILLPKMNDLAGNVAADIMSGSETGAANYVPNPANYAAVVSPTQQTFLLAGAALDRNSARRANRRIVMAETTQANVVNSLTAIFNPQVTISKQYESGEMGVNTLGFNWMMDQSCITHTNGSATTVAVSGADQTGNTLVIAALTGTINAGDYITIAGVNQVNRVTKQDTGKLMQFLVTANAANGATSLSIYPPITPAVGGSAVQYQTVTASPADGATVTRLGVQEEVTRRNLAFVQDAITMGSADLIMPPNVEGSRSSYDGISIRALKQYQVGTDQLIDRTDFLYGYLYVRPEWVVVVPDTV